MVVATTSSFENSNHEDGARWKCLHSVTANVPQLPLHSIASNCPGKYLLRYDETDEALILRNLAGQYVNY